MSISKFELIHTLEKIAPLDLSESWDNCGMQIDLSPKEIFKILVTLEITKENIEEAIRRRADFIVTHHPIYFTGIKKVDSNTIIGNYTASLIKEGISVYSAHTNFDKAEFGNNSYLAQLLGLKNIKNFEEIHNTGPNYIGLYGEMIENSDLLYIIKFLSKSLNLQNSEIKVIGDLHAKISKVGLCTGAGIDMMEISQLCGCQLFVTGDVKYHDGIKAKESGMNVIDAGHYGTEKIFVPNMATQLRKALGNKVEVMESEIDINPFTGWF